MCKYKLEYTSPDGTTHTHCIPEYREIIQFPPEPEPPDPLVNLQFDDLRVLATISSLTERLSVRSGVAAGLRATIGTAVEQVAATLPQGLSVRSEEPVPAAC